MDEYERKMSSLQLFWLVLIMVCFAFKTHASSGTIFYESFDRLFEERWIVSENEDYQGVWNLSLSQGHDDYGLLVTEKARKYAIVKELDMPVDLNDQTTVLQFETRLQNGLECGGAYLKYLRPQEAGWTPKEFDNTSPYSIMFGPDKCGPTNKVHFIINHKNPKTGKYVEHHLNMPPVVPSDKMTHVYTAILKPDSELSILIDGEEKKKVNIMSNEDFQPSLIPPATIPDPEDKMPTDWDEREKIPNQDAKKPDDWDEDAPMEILDEEAEKPEGWLDDEPDEVDDPDAEKPEDWDDEEDGEWEAPKIDNPKCETAPGCGEWKRPMKRNPNYKGKWYAPLIDNPNYMGIWKACLIPNEEYFELDKPNLEPVAAIGIEIWTMQDGILFDNILIANNEQTAASIRDATWKPKFSVEKENQTAEEQAASIDGLKGIQKSVFDVLYKIADLPILSGHKMKNVMKTMMMPSRGTTTFATWTASPKMKAYSPAAAADDHDYGHTPKPSAGGGVKGAYAPVYISLGLIMMSVSIGVFTATHQLRHSPNVYVKKSKRETLPELVEPDEVAQESNDFINKSFFRKIAHVQDADRQEIMPDPIRGDTYAMRPKPQLESLKSVGVQVEKKPFVEPPPTKH